MNPDIYKKEWEEIPPLQLVELCGGYYECPRGSDGKRLGPLVGYAGRDKYDRQYVGDVYVNFAKAEKHVRILGHFASQLIMILSDEQPELFDAATGFCGAPEGGKALACMMANDAVRPVPFQYIYPEKQVIEVATPTSREKSRLIFDRHEPEEGELWWIVEDVCNEFSTTENLIGEIEKYGAKVAGIACFLNRSMSVDAEFKTTNGSTYPVIPLVRKPIDRYSQDDLHVAEDVARGNVLWKPKKKDEWSKLKPFIKSVL